MTAIDRNSMDVSTRRKPRLLWVALAAGALVIGLALVMGITRSADAPNATPLLSGSPTWFEVTRRSFDLTVIAAGELEAKKKVDVKSEIDGTATIEDIIPEGTRVKAGDTLVKFADDEIKTKIEEELLSVEKASAENVAAEQALAIQENESASDIKAAQLKLTLAELDFAKWQKGSDPQQQRDLTLALEKAKRALDRAKDDLALSEQLFTENFISKNERDDDRTKLLEAESDLATAELNVQVYDSFTRPKEEKQFTSDVEQARAELERTKRKADSDLERLRADLQSKSRSYKIREDRLAKWRDQLTKTVIKAPEDGLVVYTTSIGPAWRRQSPMSQGRQVRTGEAILILPDTRQMVAALKVNEALIGKVKLDQPVSVTIDALGPKPLNGVVSQINVTADDGGFMNPDLREYVVRVDLPPNIETLKPAMRASGQIKLGKVENAITVPVQAIFSEGSERFCYLPDGLGVRKQPVKVGRASEVFAEVTNGLNEGDRVLLRKPGAGEIRKL
ncbi:MAG: efflux RND transporter periplasmic adaptor subunit [Phycisphaeraceae bacterium]|nr:efflux RND transporter periplasmic adaptor subunit [Phycisphaeraceae bacterium]